MCLIWIVLAVLVVWCLAAIIAGIFIGKCIAWATGTAKPMSRRHRAF